MMETLLYFVVGLLGVLAHFLKSKVKGQTAQSITQWFGANLKDTILSLIAYVVAFLAAWQMGGLNYMAAFLTGYTCDSIFTRSGKQEDTKGTEKPSKKKKE